MFQPYDNENNNISKFVVFFPDIYNPDFTEMYSLKCIHLK